MTRIDPTAAVLRDYRSGFFGCLTGWADAAFELCDALLCAPTAVASIPALSLCPVFRRSHGSLYKALARGGVDAETARDVQVAFRPVGWPAVFAVDASSWPRCDAETSPQRGFYHHPSRQSAGKPIVAGWNYSWIAQLNFHRDSWTAPLDVTRIGPREDTGTVTAAQVTALVGRLKLSDGAADPVPLFVFDAGYDPAGLSVDLAGVRAQIAVRIRDDRVFYRDPPPTKPGATGRPHRHGAAFRLKDPSTWGTPDTGIITETHGYGNIQVDAWSGLHPRLGRRGRWKDADRPPIITGTIIRVQVDHLPKPTARVKKTLWLWWAGPPGTLPDLQLCWQAYLHRFDIEHTLRFAKQTLGWTTPAVCTPQQADRWTWLIIAAHTQLRLARGIIADQRLPWERPRSPDRLSPNRIRRGFAQLATTLGTPASPPKSKTPGPGRPKGTKRPPRARHPAIKKTAPPPAKV